MNNKKNQLEFELIQSEILLLLFFGTFELIGITSVAFIPTYQTAHHPVCGVFLIPRFLL